MGELFDRVVVVDWSAAGRPVTGANSIWIAVVDDRIGEEPRLSNPSTRRRAEREVAELIGAGRRTLLAVDASLGHPSGSARWFRLDGDVAWRAMWQHVTGRLTDDEANVNDRFEVAAALNRRGGVEGPFWGRPVTATPDGLPARKPAWFPVSEFRLVEQRLRAAGRRPASGWQLLGAGSVGGQTLTLLPVLHRLVAAGAVDVWPFTTGLAVPRRMRATTVVAEAWPTVFDPDLTAHPVRDAAQVHGVARRLREVDRAGDLARWFEPGLDRAAREAVESEEGWVLMPPESVGSGPAG